MDEKHFTADERLRIECLAKAVSISPGASAAFVVEMAKQFETYVKMGKNNGLR